MESSRRRPAFPARPAWGGRRRLALAALVVTVTLPASAAMAAPPGTARGAALTNGLSLTWTGTRGFLLTVPARTQLPTYGARLRLRGGTYALVRWSRDCTPRDSCPLVGWLDYHRDMAPFTGGDAADGTDHDVRIGDGGLAPGVHSFYLFTDGTATLTFDAPSRPRGLRTMRPIGRVTGGVIAFTAACPTVGCTSRDGYGGRLRFGGAAVNVGRAGATDVSVGSFDRAAPPAADYPQPHPGRPCVYPALPGDPTSTDPADHPFGCDVTGADADTLVRAVRGTAGLAARALPHRAVWTTDGNTAASGPVYLGFQAGTGHDLADPVVVAYGVWLTYGVR